MTFSQTHVDGCGFRTRHDLETVELVKAESPPDTSESDLSNYNCRRNEVIEESDIVIAGFETLENLTTTVHVQRNTFLQNFDARVVHGLKVLPILDGSGAKIFLVS